ncbi:MAG: hypothetical protein HXX18_15030 [Bacteroidetes bacterium]|nr:hypothetical protein [Bacteroidota bacterium]
MYDNIKQTHDKKYYYYVQSDSLSREALFIEDLEDKDSLIDYYNKTEKGINPYINFKCYPVPIDTIVFIMNYETKDSLIAKVLFHYKIEYGDENNKVAYVYTKLLHDKKYKCHQDSIVKKEQ